MAEKSVFDWPEFADLREVYAARRQRFGRYWRYYKAEYSFGGGKFNSMMGQYVQAMLGNQMKPLFTPLARAVNLDVALIPGDWTLAPEAADLQEMVDVLFDASRWEVESDLYVKYAVSMGEAGLRIVDDRIGNRVSLAPIRPDLYVVQPSGLYDLTPALAIFMAWTTDKDGRDVELAEVFTPAQIRTYRNGEPASFDGRPAEYDNALGFVPLVQCIHDAGDGQPEATFDDTITALDQVNRQATQMAKIIERHAEPQWAAFGAEDGDLEKSGDSVWFFPEGSDIKAILAQVDFDGLLAFIQEIKTEMKNSLPELAFRELVGVNRIAAATIELQMAEAVFKIRRLRKPHDWALAQAIRLCGRAAATMSAPVTALAGLDTALMRFDKDRPVITIDALTRLQIESMSQGNRLGQMALEREQMLLNAGQGME